MAADIYRATAHDHLSLEELGLYHAIMGYRAALGLDAIPLSRALTATAGRHVLDTRENIWGEGDEPPRGANYHSWSDAPYASDHSRPEVMWFAPERLGIGYASPGYEITGVGYADSVAVLEGWQDSPGHDDILANRRSWADVEYLAIGIGVETSDGPGRFAGRVHHVWFGEAADEPPTIRGTGGDDDIRGTAFADRIESLGGDDAVYGSAGADTVVGGSGNDVIRGGPGSDRLLGSSGRDAIYGHAGRDTIYGGSGSDRVSGGSGGDTLHGGSGADRISGGTGPDRIHAGLGADILDGGAGGDRFVFTSAADAGLGRHRDRILDFEPGRDRIDLRGIDARRDLDGDQAFEFGHSGPGGLHQSGNVVRGHMDADGRSDLQLVVYGGHELSADDLLL